jgi:hypothetical protein
MRDKYGRKQDRRTYKKVLLVVCCGETEVKYFQLLINSLKVENLRITLSSQSDDESVVKEAMAQKQNDSNLIDVWAVFDKNSSTNFNNVIKYANNNDINCAYSNIAFEYWFYLHFKGDNKAMSLDEIKNELDKCLCFNYNKKSKTIERVYRQIEKHLSAAEDNAKRGHSKHIATYGEDDPATHCSSTTVYKLIERLREWKG